MGGLDRLDRKVKMLEERERERRVQVVIQNNGDYDVLHFEIDKDKSENVLRIRTTEKPKP